MKQLRQTRRVEAARAAARRSGRARRGGGVARLCAFCLREAGSVVAKMISFAAIAALFLLLVLDGTEVVMQRLDPRVQDWAAERLGAPEVTIGSVGFSLGRGEEPAGLTLNDIRVGGPEAQVVLPRLETGFSVLDGVQGRIRPRTVEIGGAAITLARLRDGALSISGAPAPDIEGQGGAIILGAAGSPAPPPDIQGFLLSVAEMQRADMVSRLETVELSDISLAFLDHRSGGRLTTDSASARLRRSDTGVSGSVRAVFDGVGGTAGGDMAVQASFSQSAPTGETRIAVDFDEARPADLAAQVRALEWMRLIDAPVSGSLAAVFSGDGELVSLSGRLALGAGWVNPLPGRRFGFDGAGAYFSFDPGTGMFQVDELKIDSRYGHVESRGAVRLSRAGDGALEALTGQMALSDVRVDVPAYLSRPLAFSQGDLAARVRFDPFRIDIGRAALSEGEQTLTLSGGIRPTASHWDVALDATLGRMERDTLLSLWPEDFRPGLRRWLDTHVEGGRMERLAAYFRQGAEGRRVALDFAFDGATARPIRTLPPIVGARGTGQLMGDRLDLVLDAGRTHSDAGPGIDLAGSRFIVADTRPKPATAEIRLLGSGAIPEILSLIDREPLRLLSRAGRTPGLAEGRAKVAAILTVPLRDDVRGPDIGVDVAAELRDLRSDRLVPGRSLTADRLTLTAGRDRLSVSGPVAVDGVPLQVSLDRADPPDGRPSTTIDGTLVVSDAALRGLGIALPPGTLRGQGSGRFRLSLAPGQATAYDATVGLGGAALSIPALDWSKSSGSTGRLEISGRLPEDAPPRIDRVALSAPGLDLEGALTLGRGGLTGADLTRLRRGDWLDAPVRWRRADRGAEVEIRGGRIDLRADPDLGGGGGGPLSIDFAPDEVVVTDTLRLTGVRGRIDAGQGSRGRFSGRINGRSPIDGVIQPGPRIYLQSNDGGAALRDAGLFRNAVGGTLRVALQPRPRGSGLTGAVSLKETRVVNAPVLAEMLDVATIFGLADRLNGPGIGFADVQARFAIRDNTVTVNGGRAVGASLGITLDGAYDLRRGRFDMTGVVSPFYMVNGLFERLPLIGRVLGGRPGEGLLGANFRLKGTAAQPQVAVNPLSVLTPGVAREIFGETAASR